MVSHVKVKKALTLFYVLGPLTLTAGVGYGCKLNVDYKTAPQYYIGAQTAASEIEWCSTCLMEYHKI